MNNLKIVLSLVLLTLSGITIEAQTDYDPIRYSRTTFGGTARGMATAGAFGSLGGDFTG